MTNCFYLTVDSVQVEAVCDAVDELHITLKKFVRAEEDRYTASHTKVENFQSQLKDINARRQYSQATIEVCAIYQI